LRRHSGHRWTSFLRPCGTSSGTGAPFRCTTDISSDIILGQGYAKEGFSAKIIAPEDQGVGFLRAEGGIPRRMKTAYSPMSKSTISLIWLLGSAPPPKVQQHEHRRTTTSERHP